MKLLKGSTYTIIFLLLIVVMLSCDDEEEMLVVVASYEQTIDENTGTVTFQNTSQNGDTYLWNFGDGGATSTEENPVRNYLSGSYTVSLTATATNGKSDVFETTLDLTGIKQIATNGDFEEGDGTTGWLFFTNGGIAEVDNTLSNGGGSNSAKITANGPGNPGIKQERIGIGTVSAGDVIQIQFDHIGAVTQPGAVFNVLLFIERGEGEAGDPITHIFDPRPTLTDSWSTFTATYTIPTNAVVTGGVSFLIESVCGGDAGCSVSANVDNVSITLNP